jgi:hypothetical protein
MGGRLRRSYAKRQEFKAIKTFISLLVGERTPPLPAELSKIGAAAFHAAADNEHVGRYCDDPTQTRTSGALDGLAAGPQEAPLSPSICAGFRVGPQ